MSYCNELHTCLSALCIVLQLGAKHLNARPANVVVLSETNPFCKPCNFSALYLTVILKSIALSKMLPEKLIELEVWHLARLLSCSC